MLSNISVTIKDYKVSKIFHNTTRVVTIVAVSHFSLGLSSDVVFLVKIYTLQVCYKKRE